MNENKELSRKYRYVYMTGAIDEPLTKDVITKLYDLYFENPVAPITLMINSYGGEVDSCLAIHDVIKSLRCPVITLCVGKAMSAAFITLISGTKGHRYIFPNARVMAHEMFVNGFGFLRELSNELNESRKLQERLNEIILQSTKIKKKDLPFLLQKDSYFDASECLKFGIVDKVIVKMDAIFENKTPLKIPYL